jgi:hypothetical protein
MMMTSQLLIAIHPDPDIGTTTIKSCPGLER